MGVGRPRELRVESTGWHRRKGLSLVWSCVWRRRDSALRPQMVLRRFRAIFPVCLSCFHAILKALPARLSGSSSSVAHGRRVMGGRNLPVGCSSDPGHPSRL